MTFFPDKYQKEGRKEINGHLTCGVFFLFLNVILNSKDLLFIIYKVLASCPSKARLQKVCWLKAFYALFRDSMSFKIVCLFLLFFDFCFLLGKTKLFLEIAGNESKSCRYSKQKMRTFYSWSRIKNKDILSCNAWHRKHCAFDWHLCLPLHLCKLLQMQNLKLFQEIEIV